MFVASVASNTPSPKSGQSASGVPFANLLLRVFGAVCGVPIRFFKIYVIQFPSDVVVLRSPVFELLMWLHV